MIPQIVPGASQGADGERPLRAFGRCSEDTAIRVLGECLRKGVIIAEFGGREHDLMIIGETSQHLVEVADERKALEYKENAHVVTTDLIVGTLCPCGGVAGSTACGLERMLRGGPEAARRAVPRDGQTGVLGDCRASPCLRAADSAWQRL